DGHEIGERNVAGDDERCAVGPDPTRVKRHEVIATGWDAFGRGGGSRSRARRLTDQRGEYQWSPRGRRTCRGLRRPSRLFLLKALDRGLRERGCTHGFGGETHAV